MCMSRQRSYPNVVDDKLCIDVRAIRCIKLLIMGYWVRRNVDLKNSCKDQQRRLQEGGAGRRMCYIAKIDLGLTHFFAVRGSGFSCHELDRVSKWPPSFATHRSCSTCAPFSFCAATRSWFAMIIHVCMPSRIISVVTRAHTNGRYVIRISLHDMYGRLYQRWSNSIPLWSDRFDQDQLPDSISPTLTR